MGIGIIDKLKVTKEAMKMGVGGMQKKVDQLQQVDKDFKQKELAILEKFEDKLEIITENQNLILKKLNLIHGDVK